MLSACTACTKRTEDAQDDYEGNGLFTHFILEALRGAADRNGDGLVSVAELGPYLTEAVRKASGGSQEPFLRSFGDDVVLTGTTERKK